MSRLKTCVVHATALWMAVVLAGPAARAASSPTSPAVDETALRYYAASRQLARVEAETRRLQRLNPGWQQPKDIWLEELGHGDEEQLWVLFAADNLGELQARIDARHRREPAWRPSRTLSLKLERKRRRLAIVDAGRAGRWNAVASLAAKLEEDEVDPELLWTVAESFVRSGRPADGQAVLQRILVGSRDLAVRLGTVQKALALLDINAAEAIIAEARVQSASPNELDAVVGDLTRARVAAFLHRSRREPVSQDEIAALGTTIRATRDSPGASLLGWYAFARHDDVEALEWFKLAIATGGDPETAHGLAHTLRRLGYAREAEEVAYAWREPLVQNAILYTDLVEALLTSERPVRVEKDRLERYARVVAETQSGEGAQALAWYASNLCQDEVALSWFERAVAWFPKEATVMGYANTLRRLKRQRDFIEVVNRYDGIFPRVVDLLFKPDDQRAPSPCDAQAARPAPAASPLLTLDRSGAADVPAASRTNAVPKPPGETSSEAPKIRRVDFPIPVSAENPRREGRIPEAPKTGQASAGSWRRDAPGSPPIIARRVVGVAPMPYEAYGIALLPAYDGGQTATFVAPDTPPAGTLWAVEKALITRAGRPASIETAAVNASRFVGRGRPGPSIVAGGAIP